MPPFSTAQRRRDQSGGAGNRKSGTLRDIPPRAGLLNNHTFETNVRRIAACEAWCPTARPRGTDHEQGLGPRRQCEYQARHNEAAVHLALRRLEGSARNGNRGVGQGSRGNRPHDQHRQPRRRRQYAGHGGRDAREEPRRPGPAWSSRRKWSRRSSMSSRAKPTTSTAGASTRICGTRPFPPPRLPAAPDVPPASKCTRNRVDDARSLVGETGPAQAGIDGFLAERRILRRRIPI